MVGRDDGRGRDRSVQRDELFTAARAADVAQGGVKQATRDGVIEPASARLEQIVRACSTAAATEADFVHVVRREGVAIRPRYAAGDTGDVVGYSVALQPPADVSGGAQSPRKTIWYGGGKLAKDLTLPRLRRCWSDDPGRATDTLTAWRTAPRPTPTEGVKPARDDTQTRLREAQAVRLDLDRWLQDARRIPVTDTAAWARFARDTAGILAAWSLRTETRPGPLARAAAVVARSAQLHARDDTTATTAGIDVTATRMWAAMLLAAAPGANPSLANLAVLAQIVRTVGALADAHHAAGELHRQQDLTRLTVTELPSGQPSAQRSSHRG